MRAYSIILSVLLLLPPGGTRASPSTLHFQGRIGEGWRVGASGWMSFVAFSPDGKTIASDAAASPDDTSGDLTLWTFPKGRLIRRLPGQPTAISPDWKYYATPHGVRDMADGKPVMADNDNLYAEYAFSPDSRYVAETAPQQHGENQPRPWSAPIRVLDLADGRQVAAFGSLHAFSIAISPDGKTLASGAWNTVTLWNMFTGERLAVLRGFGRYAESLSFSRDGRLLAAGSDFGHLQIWNVRHRRKISSATIDGGHVAAPAFSPDGRLVALGVYGTGAVWLVDVRSGRIIDHRKVSDIGCGSAAFGPRGRFLITPSTGGLIKWPYDRGGSIRVFRVRG